MRGIFWLIVGLIAGVMYAHTGHVIPFTMAILSIPYGAFAIMETLTRDDDDSSLS